MSEGFAYLDILFFAMLAAFIAFRLRGVLGRKTGHERQRTVRTPDSEPAVAARPEALEPPARTVPDDEQGLDRLADPSLKAEVARLRAADPGFAVEGFLEGARTAFGMILEAFAKGDRESLEPLLAPDVYRSFEAAIDSRGGPGAELVAIDDAVLDGVAMDGSWARVTVRFMSQQIEPTQDGSDAAQAAVTERVVDLWTFARDTRSRDPNWRLVETRTPEA